MIKNTFICAVVLITTAHFSFSQSSVSIYPLKDNTLYQNSSGTNSNGKGPELFAGLVGTSQPAGTRIRRTVLEFDVASAVPAGATIDSVVFKIYVNRVPNSSSYTFGLYKLSGEWGEGTSNAGTNGGHGTTSTTNDATWKHRYYSGTDWTSLGGDYASTPSATKAITTTGSYTFTGAGLKTDVQGWLNDTSSNHGWIIIGNETTSKSVKRFSSREASSNKPELIIYYSCTKASFTVSSGCINTPTSFTNTSTGAVSYRWDFDNDGTVDDTTANPSYIYTSTGFKTIELLSIGAGGCKDSTTKSILVFGLPTASFKSDTVCLGSATTLSSGGLGTKYEWDFNNDGVYDQSGTNPTINHSFLSSGVLDVKFRFTDFNGCKDETSGQVLVPIKPTADFSSDVVCGKSATTFQNLSAAATGNNNYYWDFDNDGISDFTSNNLSSVNYTYPSGGTKQAELLIKTEHGCLDSVTNNITVDTIPLIQLKVDTVCVGVTTNIIDQSTHIQAGSSYKWDFDNDGTFDDFTAGNKSKVFTNIGTNLFKLVIEGANGCKDSVTANAVTTQGIKVDVVADTVCLGTATTFTDNSIITSTVDYRWDFTNDGTVDDNTEGNTGFTYATAGIHTVKLAIEDPSGCKDSTTFDVEVYELPTVAFTADTVCLGATTTFNDNSITGFGPTYNWDFEDDGIIDDNTESNTTHIYTTGGVQTAKLKITSLLGCTDSTSVDVFVKTKAGTNFDVTEDDPDVILTNNSTGDISSFEWDFGDGNINNTDAGLTYTYDTNGTYTVCLKNTNDCGDSILCKDVTITGVFVNNVTLLDAFMVTPNPFANKVNIISRADYNYSVKVTDVQGKTIYTDKAVKGNTQINLADYKKGVYFITITTEVGAVTHKIIKAE